MNLTPELNKQRVLVTGASGFLGKALLERCRAEGLETSGLDLYPGPYVDMVADLCSASSWTDHIRREQYAYVFHMAGSPRATDPNALEYAHIVATENLLDAISGTGAILAIPSSVAVYGPQDITSPTLDETSPCQPAGEYASSKLAQEQLALERANEIGGVCIARISNPIGAAQPESFFVGRLVAEALRAASRADADRIVEMGSLAGSRDFIDVRDVVDVMRLLMKRREVGVFNLASGRETPLRKVAHLVAKNVGNHVEIRENDKIFSNVIVHQRISTARLAQRTGWHARRTLEQAIEDIIRAHRNAFGSSARDS